jgi:hypothetical protein
MNPTGVIGSGSGNVMPGQASTPFSSFMPGTGGAGNMNFGNAANPNPAMTSGNPAQPTGATPVMNPGQPAQGPAQGPTTVTGQNNQTTNTPNTFNQTQRQGDRTLGELQTYYGEGMGSLIYQYLQSGGGYNSAITQQAVDSQVNAMGQQIGLGANDLTSRLGAMGVTGSGLTDSLTNYENQAVTQENAITSQEFYNMWNQSQAREASMLSETANVNATGTANQSNWMDYLAYSLQLVGDVAGVAHPSGGGNA